MLPTHRSEPAELPDKLYFKVGEVSEIVGVPPYVLRFWETEFARIKPTRTAAGQRLYRKKDVELILSIRHLLYEEKFTIEGARKFLKTRTGAKQTESLSRVLDEIRTELKKIRDVLE